MLLGLEISAVLLLETGLRAFPASSPVRRSGNDLVVRPIGFDDDLAFTESRVLVDELLFQSSGVIGDPFDPLARSTRTSISRSALTR